jgi:hypothetical protein
MDFTSTTRRVALSLAAAAALLVLLAAVAAGPAVAAPRMGITRARGLPAESTVTTAGGPVATHPLTAASITAPITHREDYFVMPWGAAWAIGAVGALLLLSGASRSARARRRASLAEPAEFPARRPLADERRKAA